jgi:hypothetical protein
MSPTFSHLFRPLHHLFTTFSVREIGTKRLDEKKLQKNLFRIEGTELYGKTRAS